MKVIPKYFVGGVQVNIPSETPVVTADYVKSGSSKSSDGESGSKKSYLEQIFDPKAKMLASDATVMASLAAQAGRLEASPGFSALSKPQQFAAIYGQYITRATMAQTNYETLKEAKDKMISNGAAQEAAITSEGLLLVHKNGDSEISIIRPSEFNPSKDVSVTNAELTNLRANNPQFAFNDKIMSTLMGATSMKEIRDIINTTTARLKSSTGEIEYYVNPLADRDDSALQALAEAHITEEDLKTMDLGTLLKRKVKTKDNIEQIQSALKAIFGQFTPQQKALLQLRAKEFGGKASAETMVLEYLASMREYEKSITLDIEHTFNSGNAEARSRRLKEMEGSGKSAFDKQQMPDAAAFVAEYGEVSEHRFSNGSRGSIIINGVEMPVSDGKNNIGRVNLIGLEKSSFGGVFDLFNTTIGGVTIGQEKWHNVLVDGNKAINAALPVDKDALAEGIVRPDLEACSRLQQAWKELKSMGINEATAENAQQINQVLQRHNLPLMFQGMSNGKPILSLTDYRHFAVMQGFVDGAALPDGGTWNYALEELKGSDADAILKQFKKHSEKYVGANTGGFLGFGEHPAIYKGTFFIPLRNDMNTAYVGSGIVPTVAQREAMARREIHKNSQRPQLNKDNYNTNY